MKNPSQAYYIPVKVTEHSSDENCRISPIDENFVEDIKRTVNNEYCSIMFLIWPLPSHFCHYFKLVLIWHELGIKTEELDVHIWVTCNDF